jgi:tetratricopeptide (TPR) repeat protein
MANHFWATGDPDRAIIAGQRALEIAATLGDFALRIEVDQRLGHAYHSLGDYRRALECFGRNVATLQGEVVRERFGLPFLPSVDSRVWLVRCFAELGEFAEAIAPGEEAVRIAEAVDHPFSLSLAYLHAAPLYQRKGEFPKAILLLERGLGVCQAWQVLLLFPQIASALGYAYALAGRVAEALPLLEQAAERDASMRFVAGQSLRVAYLSEAYLLAGRMEDAIQFARRALDLSRNHKERGHEAWALRLLGEIASHRDPPEVEEAENHYRQALVLAGELGMRPLLAHCHLGLGKLYRRTGQGERAQEHLTTATTMYREMDMGFWLEKAEVELKALGI